MSRTVGEKIIDGLRSFARKLERGETIFSTTVSIWDTKSTGPCEHSTQDHYIKDGVMHCSECESRNPRRRRRNRQGGREDVDKRQLGPSG